MKYIWFALSPRALAGQDATMFASPKRNTASPMSCTLRQRARVEEEKSILYTSMAPTADVIRIEAKEFRRERERVDPATQPATACPSTSLGKSNSRTVESKALERGASGREINRAHFFSRVDEVELLLER